ncbi:MAG TPA: DUF4261 domain-containing protein [Anaeromyxobacter sp.]|nr:DUF4261 domain-containing protein [Anaeromyxobacter sp.]
MEAFHFTQCACVLFDRAPPLEDVARVLAPWNVGARPKEGEGEDAWAVSGPGYVAPLRSGTIAVVDVLDRPWPSAATAEARPAIASAFDVGAFGPGATPGALARAADQPWLWDQGEAVASGHAGFVRVRTGNVVGEVSTGGASQEPAGDRDPTYELRSLTELAQALLRLPGALALFVPAGEALRSREQVDAAMARKIGVSPPPLELWTNLRAIALLREGEVSWLAIDVIGMRQLGLPDQEALFAEGEEEPEAVEALLHDACLHVLSGNRIAAGATADDRRGHRWKMSPAVGLVAPRRPVLRWLPEGSQRIPEAALAKLSATAGTGSGRGSDGASPSPPRRPPGAS